MKNKRFWLGMLVLALAFGMTVVGCGGEEEDEPVAPTITTTSLPNGTMGAAYSQTLKAEGDTPITWSIDTGSLPDGLTLSTAGVISGTPVKANTLNFTFSVKATNSTGSDTKALSINILMVWTAVADSTFNTMYPINGIAYGNNRFVAGGSGGKMAYSDDNGVTWTAVSDSTFNATSSISAIAYDNGKWVAGGGNKIAYSTDCINWTSVDSTFGNDNIRYIAYKNDRFVAAGFGGSAGKMVYSSDGTSWTALPDGSSSDVLSFTANGNGMYVKQGDLSSSSRQILYSTDDGASWTSVDSTFGTSNITGIAYGNGRFVAVGEYGKMAYMDW